MLLNLYSKMDINKALIYCSSKESVLLLEMNMQEDDFSVSAIHEEMMESERED